MKKTTGKIRTLLCALAVAFSGFFTAATASATDYYISPQGSDSNTGRSEAEAVRTFQRALTVMSGGDTLVLLDGYYSIAENMDLGEVIAYYNGTGAGPVPDGLGPDQPTRIVAKNPGEAVVEGRLFLGRSSNNTTAKREYIHVDGITFLGRGHLYNTAHVTITNCGFADGFGIGTSDHPHGNSDNLVQDVWIWARQKRIIAINYRSHNNVWRRVVLRGDGCNQPECVGSGNPNVGITVYDSHHVSLQNILVADRILGGGSPYSDFAVAQHTADPQYYIGFVEWLGTMSINAPDKGYYFEPDQTQNLDPTFRLENFIAWNAAGNGFTHSRDTKTTTLKNGTLKVLSGDALRIAPDLAGKNITVENLLIVGAGEYGVNSSVPVSHINVDPSTKPFRQSGLSCTNCSFKKALTSEGGSPVNLLYLPQINPEAFLANSGTNGNPVGATIVNRYGEENSRYGEAGFNELTTIPLWPWPNEERIRKEMCEAELNGGVAVTRGFCASMTRVGQPEAMTITRYVWEQLENRIPDAIYGTTDTGTTDTGTTDTGTTDTGTTDTGTTDTGTTDTGTTDTGTTDTGTTDTGTTDTGTTDTGTTDTGTTDTGTTDTGTTDTGTTDTGTTDTGTTDTGTTDTGTTDTGTTDTGTTDTGTTDTGTTDTGTTDTGTTDTGTTDTGTTDTGTTGGGSGLGSGSSNTTSSGDDATSSESNTSGSRFGGLGGSSSGGGSGSRFIRKGADDEESTDGSTLGR